MSTESKYPVENEAPETDFSALDAELKAMAEETPEVPEDFHENWTRAVRDDAALRREIDTPETEPVSFRRQLRYILSAAAVFVFLIAGTMITRARRPATTPETNSAPEARYEESAAGTDAEDYEAAVFESVAYESAAYEESYDTACEAPAEADVSAEAGTENSVLTLGASLNDSGAAAKSAAPLATSEPLPDSVVLFAASVPSETAEEAEEADQAEEAEEAVESEDEAPDPETVQDVRETAEENPETAEDSAAPGFWSDFIDFSAAALPWLLGAGVLAAFVYAIFKSRQER